MIRGGKGMGLAAAMLLAGCGGTGNGGDGPTQDELRDALVRNGARVQSIERIACKAAPDKPGFICDFRAVTCSGFTKKCDKSLMRTARFVNVSGSWMFMGDVASPSTGYNAAPEAEDTAMVNAAGPVQTPAAVPSPTPSALLTPTPSPTASPSPRPSTTATPAPRPTPTATPTPKPSPSPLPTPTRSVPPKSPGTGVGAGWLQGRWGRIDGDCDAKHAVQFSGGGIFYGKRGAAHWTLKGKTVTVTGTDTSSADLYSQTLAIERTGDDTMTLEGRRYRRCAN